MDQQALSATELRVIVAVIGVIALALIYFFGRPRKPGQGERRAAKRGEDERMEPTIGETTAEPEQGELDVSLRAELDRFGREPGSQVERGQGAINVGRAARSQDRAHRHLVRRNARRRDDCRIGRRRRRRKSRHAIRRHGHLPSPRVGQDRRRSGIQHGQHGQAGQLRHEQARFAAARRASRCS